MVAQEETMAQRKKKGFESYFENHVAKIINLSDITIIDYFNPKYQVQYNVRFIFDKKNCSLAITGDFGNLTAQNYYNLGDYHKTYEHFCNSPEYFVKKLNHSTGTYFLMMKMKQRNTYLSIFYQRILTNLIKMTKKALLSYSNISTIVMDFNIYRMVR